MAQVLSLLFALLSSVSYNNPADLNIPAESEVLEEKPTFVELVQPSVHAAEVFYSPSRLKISTISLDAPVLSVGADVDGTQFVPADNKTLSWWKHGAKPGEKGSSVLAGHYKIADGSPGVFYRLNEVKVGETISVLDENGAEQSFKVMDRKIFSVSEFPTKDIYNNTDSEQVNLVTCTGDYIPETNNYTHRLVLYTEKVK